MGFRRLGFLLSVTLAFALAACGDNKHPIFEDANTDMSGDPDSDVDGPPDALTCPTGETKCGAVCVDLKTDGDNCGACGTDCGLGTCQTNNGSTKCCGDGETNCSGTCVDTKTNPDHCGQCGTDCGLDTCQTSGTNTMCCPANTKNCNGTCINTNIDEGNCGDCAALGGAICGGTNETCCGGACVDTDSDEANCEACGTMCGGAMPPECTPPATGTTSVCCANGQSNCNGVCSTPAIDNNNCGGCGIVCQGLTSCQAPDSGSTPFCCLASENNCDAVCSNPLEDEDNCGGCAGAGGVACTGTDTCTQGLCCGPGEIRCGSVCVDPNTSAANCGGCAGAGGTTCGGGTPVCSDGGCTATCDTTSTPPETQCPATGTGPFSCVVLDSDPNNCGACGNICAANAVCNNGTCTPGTTCTSPEVVCNGACVDTQNDDNNCNACGAKCGTGQDCDEGICCDSGKHNVPGPGGNLCCVIGEINCNGQCKDPLDAATCGGCLPANNCGTGTCTNDAMGGIKCCPAGTARCGADCVDLTASEAHCGACNNDCAIGDECAIASTPPGGPPTCCDPATELNCGGNTCINKLTDDNNCGGCGAAFACDSGESCSGGDCCPDGQTSYRFGANQICCAAGTVSCTGLANSCVNLSNNNANCGTTCQDKVACSGGEVCVGGSCEANCNPLTNCSGSCIDTNTNAAHCGACDDPCPLSNQTCSGGNCQACPNFPPLGCNGACVDTTNNDLNCGDCNIVCDTDESCSAGNCCLDGTNYCDLTGTANDGCKNFLTDNANCGACGNACANGTTCQNGSCACSFGQNTCPAGSPTPPANQNACRYNSVDPAACGVNCIACGAGEVCVSGGCRATCPPPLTECLTENETGTPPFENMNRCVNTGSDSSHCGGCNIDCPSGTGCSNGGCVPLAIFPVPQDPQKCIGGGPPISVPTGGGGSTCTGNLGAVSFLFGLCSRTNFGPISRDLITDAFDSNVAPYIPSCTGHAQCSPQKLCAITEKPCAGVGVQTCLGGPMDVCDFPVKCVGNKCVGGGIGVNGRVPNGTGGIINIQQETNTLTDVGGEFWVFGSAGLSVKGTTNVRQELIVSGPIALTGGAGHVFGNAIVRGGWTGNGPMDIDGNLNTQLPALCSSLPASVNVDGTESCDVTFPAFGDPCGAFDNSDDSLLRIADVIVPHFRIPANNDNSLIGLRYDLFDNPPGPLHLDLPCGVYYLNSMNAAGTSTIAVHGRTAIIIGGAVRLSQQVYFDLDPNASLDIFVGGVMNVSNNVTLGSPAYPAKSRMYFGSGSCAGGGGTCDDVTDCCSGLCSACPNDATGKPSGPCAGTGTCGGGGGGLSKAISLSQGGNFNGLLWAGYGSFEHSNPLEMYGSIFTRFFDASGNTIIHYDLAAADLGDECPPLTGQACDSCRQCDGQPCLGNTCGSACTTKEQCCPGLDCIGGRCTN